MREIPERWNLRAEMRIVGQHRFLRRGHRAIDDPVVRSERLTGSGQDGRCEGVRPETLTVVVQALTVVVQVFRPACGPRGPYDTWPAREPRHVALAENRPPIRGIWRKE